MSQIRVRRDSCVIIGGMDKIVAFDQSQNMDDLKALPDAKGRNCRREQSSNLA
jgi:hypothetical protein